MLRNDRERTFSRFLGLRAGILACIFILPRKSPMPPFWKCSIFAISWILIGTWIWQSWKFYHIWTSHMATMKKTLITKRMLKIFTILRFWSMNGQIHGQGIQDCITQYFQCFLNLLSHFLWYRFATTLYTKGFKDKQPFRNEFLKLKSVYEKKTIEIDAETNCYSQSL